MKKMIISSLCFVIFFAGLASAFEVRKHTGELGIDLSYITYKEPDFDLKEKGLMYGIVGSYTYHNRFMLKVEGKGSFGIIDYSSRSGDLNNILDYMFETRVLGGYDFSLSNTFMITPFIGFGYRYLNDDAGGKTTSLGAQGYERESNYYYSPIGLIAWNKLGRGWVMGITAEYDYLWEGRQKSHLNDATPTAPTIVNKQNSGYGLRGSIKFQKRHAGIGLNIEPFVRYWNIDKSDEKLFILGGIQYSGFEPKNSSTEFGLNVSVIF